MKKINHDFLINAPAWFDDFYRSLAKREVYSAKDPDIIAATGKSREYVLRTFKKVTGQTLHSVLIHNRIEYAKKILRSTQKDIIDIAWDCGFDNLSTFYHVFRKSTGKTPKKYRDGFFYL